MASEPWCSETVGERVGLGLTGGEASQLRSRGATRGAAILLKPMAIEPVPVATAQPAHAAFQRGHVSLILRDTLGTNFHGADYRDLLPDRG